MSQLLSAKADSLSLLHGARRLMQTVVIAPDRLDTAGLLTEAYQGKHYLPWLVSKRKLLTLRVLPLKRFFERTSYLQLLKNETVGSQRECLSSRVVYLKGESMSRKEVGRLPLPNFYES